MEHFIDHPMDLRGNVLPSVCVTSASGLMDVGLWRERWRLMSTMQTIRLNGVGKMKSPFAQHSCRSNQQPPREATL